MTAPVSPETTGVLLGLVVFAAGVLLLVGLGLRQVSRTHGTCPWYIRGYHMRLRQTDTSTVWPLLTSQGVARAKAVEAWHLFLQQRGQEHWACPCGRVARVLFEGAVVRPYLEHRDRRRPQ